MKNFNIKHLLTSLLTIALIFGLVACKEKEKDSSVYVKEIEKEAALLNKKCPKDEGNGKILESVTFVNDTLLYRLTVSDQAIVKINLDDTRDSIIHNMSDKLKKFLIKGKCNLEYRYVSPNDSSSITIVPNELGDLDSEK